ncbi:MAG: 4-hydroxythreonine-4-phosphate dehydrogenase PdxA [Chloroflexota bacterium]
MLPTIGLFLGDPSGIGAEIVVKMLDQLDNEPTVNILVIGDHAVFQQGGKIAKCSISLPIFQDADAVTFADSHLAFLHAPIDQPDQVKLGEVSQASGETVLETLKFAVSLAKAGQIDAICFAPLNKQSMHLAGSPYEDDLQFLAAQFEVKNLCRELNVLDDLWTARVTSHIPLKAVSDHLTVDSVYDIIDFTHHQLRKAGFAQQRIAVAALNPHAGEGGLFGREEIDVIQPAVAKAQDHDIDAEGPFPADTVFLKAQTGVYDAIVTMYHDQGQIAMKLMGFDRGVTVHGGLPIPITTPAHGTAFDIVGQGIANIEPMRLAFNIAVQMSQSKQAKS